MYLRQQLIYAPLLLYVCIYIFYIKNNESWSWFVAANVEVFPGKVDTKFCKCLHFNFKQPIFEFFERFEAKMTVLEIYFFGLEIDRKTECSIFNWKFLKVLVLWVTASQRVNLSTIKKTKSEGKTTLPQHPMKHFEGAVHMEVSWPG